LKLAPSQLPRRYRFAALPSISLFPSVRLKLARSPHSLAATRATSPSMSLIPLLHSRMIKRSETSSHLVAISFLRENVTRLLPFWRTLFTGKGRWRRTCQKTFTNDTPSAHLPVVENFFGPRNTRMNTKLGVRSRWIGDFVHGQATVFLFLISRPFGACPPWRAVRERPMLAERLSANDAN